MSHPYVIEKILSQYPHADPRTVAIQLRYSTFVNIKKHYLYFEVPKAACTHMKELLRLEEGAPPIQRPAGNLMETRREMFVHARENVPLPALIDLDDATQRNVLESSDFFRFTIVRNPYTRLISTWKNKVVPCEPIAERLYLEIKGRLPDIRRKDLISFDEFVSYLETKCDLSACDPHYRRQADHLFLKTFNFSHVGKLENMAETVAVLQPHLRLAESLIAGRQNVSTPVGLAYNENLADRVYSLYREDFGRLGYERNSWRAGQTATPIAQKAMVSEEKFYDEIIERNLIISNLYAEGKRLRAEGKRLRAERNQLRADLQRVSRLHLLGLANFLVAIRRRARDVLHRETTTH
jgi:hypothetical protein